MLEMISSGLALRGQGGYDENEIFLYLCLAKTDHTRGEVGDVERPLLSVFLDA